MAANNAKVADLLRRYAAALSVEGANKFKIKAYRRAADTIEGLPDDVAKLIQQGSDLQHLPGIGSAISDIIVEIVRSGKLDRLERSVAQLSPELAELATRPALDSKKVLRIYRTLGIDNLEQLREQLESGAIAQHFGARMEFHVRRGLDERPRQLLYDVDEIAGKIETFLRSLKDVSHVSRVGSLRRQQDTVGDLNFLVASKSAGAVFRQFADFGGIQSAEARSKSEYLFRFSSGFGVTIHWTRAEQWGLALLEHTGSSLHLDELRTHMTAQKKRLSATTLRRSGVDLSTEEAIYAEGGLEYIEPELREGRGEVLAAFEKRLPSLVELADLRGDLHMHTTSSDGANTIEEMARAAQQRGYEYIAITDHSQSLKITNGLTEKRLLQQIQAIDKLNEKLNGITVLKSAEVDILEDGKLDYSNAVLKQLDFTICSIHSRFGRNRDQQTDRVLRAMDNPYFNILGHATGRLLLKREGYELDLERIFAHAKSVGCFFEINSSPDRLDLSDENARQAMEQGIRIAINTDAHSIAELNFMPAGIRQARRAWLSAKNVLNTMPLKKLLTTLRRY